MTTHHIGSVRSMVGTSLQDADEAFRQAEPPLFLRSRKLFPLLQLRSIDTAVCPRMGRAMNKYGEFIGRRQAVWSTGQDERRAPVMERTRLGWPIGNEENVPCGFQGG